MFRFVYYEALLAHLKAFGIKVYLFSILCGNITVGPPFSFSQALEVRNNINYTTFLY